MAQATTVGFSETCHSEVPAAKNPHQVRNATAANFAAANLGLASSGVANFGATGRYICRACGATVKVGRKPPTGA